MRVRRWISYRCRSHLRAGSATEGPAAVTGPPTVAQFPAPGETPRPSPRMAPEADWMERSWLRHRHRSCDKCGNGVHLSGTESPPHGVRHDTGMSARRWPVPLPGRLLQQRQHVAVRRTDGTAHAQLAGSVARRVGVSGVRAHFGSLICGRRSGQLRMQESAVTGKGAAAPRRRDEHLAGYGRRQRMQGFVVTRARRRAGRVQGQAVGYVGGRESRQENSGRERDRVLDREGAAGQAS